MCQENLRNNCVNLPLKNTPIIKIKEMKKEFKVVVSKVLKPTLCLLFFMFGVGTLFAQTAPVVKFGHINLAELVQAMPETKEAQAKIDAFVKTSREQHATMMQEYNTKLQAYQDSKPETLSVSIKAAKEKELQDLGARITAFQQQAPEDSNTQQQKLMEPILTKAKKAIKEVSKENKITYVFDTSAGNVVEAPEAENILVKVKAKLNIK